ncbi:MAG: hypothetical protein ACO2OY_03490 [Thermodesulfobacteriaceae bacterium]
MHVRDNSSHIVERSKIEEYPKDFLKEFFSREYKYKTIKDYLHCDEDFLHFVNKHPSGINDNDVKNCPIYFPEEKQLATSALFTIQDKEQSTLSINKLTEIAFKNKKGDKIKHGD